MLGSQVLVGETETNLYFSSPCFEVIVSSNFLCKDVLQVKCSSKCYNWIYHIMCIHIRNA